MDPTGEDGTSLLDAVGVEAFSVTRAGGEVTLSLSLTLDEGLSVEIPGTGGMRLVFGDTSEGRAFTASATLGTGVSVSLADLPVALRFPAGWFTPADGAANAEISTTVSISVSLVSGESPSVTFALQPDLSFGPFYIGTSKVMVQGTGIQFCFDPSTNPSEATAGVDYPEGGSFLGVIIGAVRVSFPETLADGEEDTAELEITNASIGTGGFTGTVTFSASKTLKVAGASIVLESAMVAFRQNALTAASLGGTLILPKFDQEIQVELSFDLSGNFSILLNNDDGLMEVSLANIADLELDEIGFSVTDGVSQLALGGKITITASGDSIDWPDISFSGLCIRSDGTISAPNGAIRIDEEASIELYGFKILVSSVGFGTTDDDRTFITLSGGISITEDLPLGVSADGFMVSWATGEDGPEDVQLSLGGVGIEFAVPDVFSFKGYLSLDFEEHRFSGQLDLTLDAIDLAVHADFLAGTDDATSTRYWFLDISVELPVAIPLGATGCGIFGFRGILAGNMKPSRTSDQDWYEDWYKQSPTGINSSKFVPEAGAVGVGAGLTFGLMPNGFVLAAKGTFLITFPGPILFVEGRASVIRDRSELSQGEPPLSALLVADFGGGTFQLGMGADLTLEKVITITGDSEAFFDFNDGNAWYIDIGKKPEEDRIRANVLDVLQATAYFTVDPSGIETGAAAMIGGSWSFGPVAVTAEISVEGSAAISFLPQQFHASLEVRADMGITVCGAGIELSASATADVQAADPYKFDATFALSIAMPSPLKDIDLSISYSWESGDPPDPADPMERVTFAHPLTEGGWDVADGYFLSGETVTAADLPAPGSEGFLPAYVPADSRPVLQFKRPMTDSSGIADNAWSVSTSGTEQVGKSTITRAIVSVALYKWSASDGTGTAELVADAPQTGDRALYACWLATVDGGGAFAGYDAANSGQKASSTQLMLWGRNPFEVTGSLGSLYDWMTGELGYPCSDAPLLETRCFGWAEEAEEVSSPVSNADAVVTLSDPFAVVARPASIPSWPEFALQVEPDGVVEIVLARPAGRVEVLLGLSGCPVRVEIDDGSGYATWEEAAGPLDRAVVAEVPGIARVRLTALPEAGANGAWFYELCYTTQKSMDALGAFNDAKSKFEDAVASRWSGEADIFETESTYYVEVVTKVTVTTEGNPNSPNSQDYRHVFEFQTYGPPGSFLDPVDISAPEDFDSPPGSFVHGADAGGPLDKLDLYVAGTAPGPATAPHYRSYGLAIAFNRDYVGELYGGDLLLRLYDDAGREVTDAEGSPLTYYGDAPPEVTYTDAEEQWLQALSDDDCTSGTVDIASFRSGGTYTAENPDLDLAPQRTYAVSVVGAGVAVYSYSFLTSRYTNFAEHLADRLDAVFAADVDEADAPDETDLQLAISGSAIRASGGTLDRGFLPSAEQHGFDEIMGLLGLGTRTPPSRLDVSLVASTSRRYALLVESSEPLPFERLTMTLLHGPSADSAVSPVADWSAVRRADGTGMLIFVGDGTMDAADIAAEHFSLQFILMSDISDTDESALIWVLAGGATEEVATLTLDLA